ncbi:hypothetical protein POX_c04524 [Penicillium oxalicum]|uniref:hypothetical protein n=1 Tax=Penicillium oxalicum TaxID=69781 RepID=UPI0020B7E261|nr:hypothetical protein POX_c04524 [Penicillium oxalicum]KAI2791658.1 hypothetical protein POX_c04524 [Penicillium oxalicum]
MCLAPFCFECHSKYLVFSCLNHLHFDIRGSNMVTLNHQRFWQPVTEDSVRNSLADTEEQSIWTVSGGQREGTDGQSYVMGSYGLREQWSTESSGKPNSKHSLAVVFQTNAGHQVSESHEHSRSYSPRIPLDDSLSATEHHPPYPEDVALHPTSQGRNSPSVTGLEGPGTTRIFDVFEDDQSIQSDRDCHEHSTANTRRRRLEDSSLLSSTRSRYVTLGILDRNESSQRRGAQAQPEDNESSSQITGTCSASKLATLRDAIGYLTHAYIVASADVTFSDGPADAGGLVKENLAVLQLATKTLQHAYGIIATGTTAIDTSPQEGMVMRSRPSVKRTKWTIEDDRRLFRLRDEKVPWSRIHDSFPGRTLGALKTRYFGKSSRQSQSPSSKESHPVCDNRQVSGTSPHRRSAESPVRRSERLRQAHHVSRMGKSRSLSQKPPFRAVTCYTGSAINLDAIDPRLRSYNSA